MSSTVEVNNMTPVNFEINAEMCQKVRLMVPSQKSKNDVEVQAYFEEKLLKVFKNFVSLLPVNKLKAARSDLEKLESENPDLSKLEAAKVKVEKLEAEQPFLCANTSLSPKFNKIKRKLEIVASTKIKKNSEDGEDREDGEDEDFQQKKTSGFKKDSEPVDQDEKFIINAFTDHRYYATYDENDKKDHCEFLQIICDYFIKLCIRRNANYRFVFVTTSYFNEFKECQISTYQATFYDCENSDLGNYCNFVQNHILRIPFLSKEFYKINKGFMDEIKSIRGSIPVISDEASICSEMSELTVEKAVENDVRCNTPHGIENILRCSTPDSYAGKVKVGLLETPKIKIAPGLPNTLENTVQNEIASALPTTDEKEFSLKMMKKVKPLSTMLQIIAQPTSVPKNDQAVSVSVPDKKYSLECDGKEVVYDNGSFVFKDNVLMNTISSVCQNYGVEKLSDVQKEIILQFHKSFRSDDAIVENSDEIFSKLKVKNQENGKFYEDCFKKRDQYFFLTETGNAVYFDKCGLI